VIGSGILAVSLGTRTRGALLENDAGVVGGSAGTQGA
jgi:hypothetical protein